MARIYDFQNYVSRTAGAPSGMPSASPPPAPLDDAGDSAMRFAGDLWPWLQSKGKAAGKFIASPRGLATGGALTLLGALAAAGNAAQTQDPSLTGVQAAAGPAGAAVGSLGTTAIGGALGGLLTMGNPLGIAAGATAANMLFGGAAAEGGADLARAVTGVSPSDRAINEYKRRVAAELEMREKALPIMNAEAEAELARRMRAASMQEMLNAQARAGQSLWGSLGYRPDTGAAIYGTVG